MLQQLVRFSLRHRGVVIALAALCITYGLYTAYHAKLDVFPDFVAPQVVIQTEAPGLSPEQVEQLVTRMVESAVNGVPGLESIRSQSIQGLSIVTIVFNENINVLTGRQLVTERVSGLGTALPSGVKLPTLAPLTSATMDLLKIGLVSRTKSLMELRTFADTTLKPRLLAAPGVAAVGIMGGEVREFQIQVDPQRLLACKIGMDDVIAAAREATGARGAGFIETENQRLVLQTEGQSLTPERLGEAVVTHGRAPNLRLRDVARVVIAPEMKFGDATIQGRPGVLLKLLSQYGSNTMEVTEAAEAALDEMKPVLDAQDIQLFQRLHRPATFIETAIRHVSESLFIGGILVVIVLFLFLFNLRAAAISITAIPLSLLIAVIILDRMGATLNTITLGGLAIAIGEVVDDAIIDVENILRRLRENRALGSPRTNFQVVLDASLEVRSAVVYATFVVALVFVPILTMSGLQGRLFAPLGMAYILAILASLLVALTVTPALGLLLLPRVAERRAGDPMLLQKLRRGYQQLVEKAVSHTRALMVLGGFFVAACVGMLARFGGEFLPEFREGHFVLQVMTVPGTGLGEMMRLGMRISHDLLATIRVGDQPAIESIEHQAGRAEQGEDPWGPHRSEIHVELRPDVPGHDQADIQEQIRKRLGEYPGVSSEVLTFLGDRIGETMTGETAAVVVNLFGDDLDHLDAAAAQVSKALQAVHGAADVRIASPPGVPQEVVQLRADRLMQFGLTPVQVLDAIQTAYSGTTAAQVFEGNRAFNVVVILAPELRREADSIGSLLLRSADGTYVPLRELADLSARTGRYMVLHDGARRRQAVLCNVEGRDLTSFVDEAKQQVAQSKLPTDTYAEFGGAAAEREEAVNEILLHSTLAGIGILLLLAIAIGNGRNLLLVLVNIPFALVGGVLAVALTGGAQSIGSLLGFVTLFGITMRNSMMMISHFEHLVAVEGMTWGRETMLRGCGERLVPILMTAMVAGLGLLPIALGSGEAGREIEGPMAIVIVGGLVTSTLLNLLVLPSLALRFGRFVGTTAVQPAAV